MIRLGLTFDDVLLVPQKTAVNRRDASVETRLTKRARLAIPLLSAASDTVSDARFAIALGKAGGLGVLHRNCSEAEQVAMVREAKNAGLKLIGAAVGPKDIYRAVALVEAGATHIFTDCAHAHAPGIIAATKEMKRKIGKAELIVGNIATKEAARDFSFADALKVGIGPGSICTTRIVSGVGVSQLTAIMDVASVANKKGIPVIADGGIRYTGDMVKALAAGASSVMLGSLFAGTEEAPGETITIDGKRYKSYRGMGSTEALNRKYAEDRYTTGNNQLPISNSQKRGEHKVAEGVTGKVPFRGAVAEVVEEYVGGIKAGMGYIGASTIEEMRKRAEFIQITNAGLRESHPHSIQ